MLLSQPHRHQLIQVWIELGVLLGQPWWCYCQKHLQASLTVSQSLVFSTPPCRKGFYTWNSIAQYFPELSIAFLWNTRGVWQYPGKYVILMATISSVYFKPEYMRLTNASPSPVYLLNPLSVKDLTTGQPPYGRFVCSTYQLWDTDCQTGSEWYNFRT